MKNRLTVVALIVLLAFGSVTSAFAAGCDRLEIFLQPKVAAIEGVLFQRAAITAYTTTLKRTGRATYDQIAAMPQSTFDEKYMREVILTGQFGLLLNGSEFMDRNWLTIKDNVDSIERIAGPAMLECNISVGQLVANYHNARVRGTTVVPAKQ